nr:MAG TPA: hypothetical protein [Caudoviricetes sp.]
MPITILLITILKTLSLRKHLVNLVKVRLLMSLIHICIHSIMEEKTLQKLSVKIIILKREQIVMYS